MMKLFTQKLKLCAAACALFAFGSLGQASADDFETGYYYITNVSDETKALWGRYPYLGWNTLDKTQPGFVFYLEKAPTETNNYGETVTDNYYMQCLDYSAWFYGIPYGYVTTLTKDKSERQTVRFTLLSNGSYGFESTTVRNNFNSAAYRQYNYLGVDTNHDTYSVKALSQWSNSAPTRQWKLTKVTDDELQMVWKNLLSQALMQAYSAYTDATASILHDADSEKLITNGTSTDAWGTGSQFFGPEEPSASIETSATNAYTSFAYLIDGNMDTRYQATWNTSVHAAPQFLQVDLGENKTVNAFRLHYGKKALWPSRSVWRDITLYATNDASIALDQTASTKTDIAGTSCHKIGSYRFPTDQTIYSTEATAGERTVDKYYMLYTDERTIDVDFAWSGDAYRYLRFYVDEPLFYNSATGKDWTVSELQMYERTEPAVIHSKQAEAEALLSAISAAESKLSAGTATEEDITTLQAAIDKMSESRSVIISSVGYATFVSDVNVILPTGLTAYYVTATDNNIATLSEVVSTGGVLPAGTPVLLKGDMTQWNDGETQHTYNLTVTTDEASISEEKTNLLQGSATEHTSQTSGTNYTLQSKDGSPIFMKYSGTTLKAGYAYLPVSTSASPAFLNISFADPTGIQSAVNEESKNAKTYDLEGRSVKHPQKGIYIQNGKKVVIK